jgi:hypothetical protein
MYRTIILLMLCILFTSCASDSAKRQKVMVTSRPDRIEGCRFVGQVESSPILVDLRAGGVAFDNVLHELKNEAKKMGANVVLTSTRTHTTGEAYQCN